MLVSNTQLFIIAFFYVFLEFQGLEQVSSKEDDIIIVTESVIRSVISELFLQLDLKGIKLNKKLRQFVIVHNFFTSVTIKDHKTLNEIVRLTRVDKQNVKNETENLMELLNVILNDDSKTADDDSIVLVIDNFISNINGYKEISGFNNNYESLEIKDEILRILLNNDTDKRNVSQNYAAPENGEKEALLGDNEYGDPGTRRIYNGKKTRIRHFPFMASIHVFNNFQCGGSILNSDLIITAASCLQIAWNNRLFRENPAFLFVRVGSNFYNGGGDYISVLEMYFHPGYNPRNLGNNLVLLRLFHHLKFRKGKKRMKMIVADKRASPLPVTTNGVTIVGWGAKSGSNIPSDALHNKISYSVLNVYGLQECQEIYSREYVTHKHFCAGLLSKGSGACNHDVGGPGIVNGILTGVVSFGSPVCGAPDAPTVFTKVGYYADWIEEIMEQDFIAYEQPTTLRKSNLPLLEHTIPTNQQLLSKQITISPILEKVTPISFKHVNNLRILKDERKFKEFLSTMFQNNEAEEIDYPSIDDNLQKDIESSSSEDGGLEFDSPGLTGSLPAGIVGNIKLSEGNFETNTKASKKYEPSNKMLGLGDDNLSIKKYLLAGITTATKTSDHNFETVKHRNKKYKKLKKHKTPVKLSNVNLSLKDDLVAGMRATTKVIKHRFQTTTQKSETLYKPFVVHSESSDSDDLIHENLAKIINHLVVSKSDEEIRENDSKKKITRMKAYEEAIYPLDRTINEDDLAVLYLSDDENNISSKDNNIQEALSIPADRMGDLAFRNNLTNAVLSIMRQSEFSDVLTEVIRDMATNK